MFPRALSHPSSVLLLAEICLCAPYSNATLERFFSQMKVVKTDWRNRLNEKNLTNLLYLKVDGPSLKDFNEKYCSKAVELWYNDKPRHMNQGKRKKYAQRKNAKPKIAKLDFNLLPLFEDSSSSESDEE